MEIRLVFEDEPVIASLKKRLAVRSVAEVIREAVSLLDWATEEVGRNRKIFSAEQDGTNSVTFESHGLRAARRQANNGAAQSGGKTLRLKVRKTGNAK